MWLPRATAGSVGCGSPSRAAEWVEESNRDSGEGVSVCLLGLESAGDRAAERPEDREAAGKRAVEGGCGRAKRGSRGVGVRTLSPRYVDWATAGVSRSMSRSVSRSMCVPEPASLGVPLCDNSGWQAHTSGTRLLHEKAPCLVGPRVAWRVRVPRALPMPSQSRLPGSPQS